MKHRLAAAALLTIATLAGCAAPPRGVRGKRALMIVGNDEKQNWNDAGAGVMSAHRPRHGDRSSTSAPIRSRRRSSPTCR